MVAKASLAITICHYCTFISYLFQTLLSEKSNNKAVLVRKKSSRLQGLRKQYWFRFSHQISDRTQPSDG
jgi:hypothetical protein